MIARAAMKRRLTHTLSAPCDYGNGRFLVGPTQGSGEKTILDQFPNVSYALETRSLKVFQTQTDLLVGLVQLHCALAGIPHGLEFGQHLGDFGAIHAIASLVWTSVRRVLDHRVR